MCSVGRAMGGIRYCVSCLVRPKNIFYKWIRRVLDVNRKSAPTVLSISYTNNTALQKQLQGLVHRCTSKHKHEHESLRKWLTAVLQLKSMLTSGFPSVFFIRVVTIVDSEFPRVLLQWQRASKSVPSREWTVLWEMLASEANQLPNFWAEPPLGLFWLDERSSNFIHPCFQGLFVSLMFVKTAGMSQL